MSNHSVIRITRELGEIQKGPDLSIAVACRDADVRSVKALIIGPAGTPYEFGFFEFAVKFGKDYPGKAPAVLATTTNGGRCRFNPNIYAQGKVCLSILGTWRGESGEEWSSVQGLESILLSIQSLMSSNPYENEPGFETANDEAAKQDQKNYVMKIRHETLRISVIQRLEEYLLSSAGVGSAYVTEATEDGEYEVNQLWDDSSSEFEPFKDLCKRRFLWYYDSYLSAISKGKTEVVEGQQFARMPFEAPSNGMSGKFGYNDLERRLKLIKQKIDEETSRWPAEGVKSVANGSSISVNLRRQFEAVVETYKKDTNITIDFELVDDNPFAWAITYFGRPPSNLEDGIIRIKLFFSPRFPEEQPRARSEALLFHHRLTVDGIPCYTAKRPDEALSHVQGIIGALEEEHPPYDPRTMVNLEAGKLYWGSADDRKLYNRQLRRSVRKTTEE